MKFAKHLLRSFAIFNKSAIFANKPKAVQTVFSTVGLGFATWFSTSKLYSEQFMTIETEDNLKDGEVREVLVGPTPQDTILVINYQGKIYSTQSKCAHFGFSLAKGLLIGNQLICPLHNAGFSIQTGDSNQGPVFDGLKTFQVERVDGLIKVKVPANGWSSTPAPKVLGKDNINKQQKIVIIGAGVSALSAAETLRKTGYKGYIYLVTKQNDLPFDRTMLSKVMGKDGPGPIRSQQMFEDNGIILVGNSTVTSIDYASNSVIIQGRDPLSYDKLLIASGVKNIIPKIQGLSNVPYYQLRTKNDYHNINTALKAPGVKNVTIIGGGFIGMEVASSIKLAYKDYNVTVIEGQKTPLYHVLGERVGGVLQKLAEKNGVKVLTGASIKELQANNVVLSNGNLQTDVLVVATGVQPVIDFANGLQLQKGGLKTNIFLQTSQKNVYAAGDVAAYPYWYTGNHTRIEHYNEAIYQGSVAALNMAGKKFPVDNIPFFWTRQFNNSLVFTGVTQGWDDLHIVGDLQEMKFVAYYIRKSDDKILGAAAMNSMNKIQIVNQAMRNGVMPNGSAVKNAAFVLDDLLKDIKKKDPKCTRCTVCQ